MERNKVRTYLLYAVGEILLVVLGILIALQINTWNQDRIEAQKESRYISELKRDLSSQIEEIQYLKERESSSLQKLNKLIDIIDENESIEVDRNLVSLFISVLERTSFTVTDPTYTELIATGNIELIRDEEVRNHIIEYYQRMEKSALIIQKNNDLNDQTIKPASLALIELWPAGFASTPKATGMINEYGRTEFPENHKVFEGILADEKNQFRIYNLVKMKLLLSASNLEDIKIAEEQTQVLVTKLENY